MKKMMSALMVAGCLSLCCNTARGSDYSPLMISIISPVQAPLSNFDIGGLKLNLIYGECNQFFGLDVGAFSHIKGDFAGVGIGAITVVDGGGAGWMINGLANHVNGEFIGWQIGVYNYATHLDGLQLGVINLATTACGVQIGLVNVIQDNSVPFIPIINCHF